nr:response regulator [Massilia sp. Dwa41.01b]
MRVIIVDDEFLARALLREYLAAHPEVEIVAECANGFEAVKAIGELQPDLVFLDIQMPKLDGFEVVELSGARTRYVFVTAYDQFALKAFEVRALDYLLKPFSRERLAQALANVAARANPVEQLEGVAHEAARRHGPLSSACWCATAPASTWCRPPASTGSRRRTTMCRSAPPARPT